MGHLTEVGQTSGTYLDTAGEHGVVFLRATQWSSIPAPGLVWEVEQGGGPAAPPPVDFCARDRGASIQGASYQVQGVGYSTHLCPWTHLPARPCFSKPTQR